MQVPINPYGKAKKMAEEIILDFSKSRELSVMILRFVLNDSCTYTGSDMIIPILIELCAIGHNIYMVIPLIDTCLFEFYLYVLICSLFM